MSCVTQVPIKKETNRRPIAYSPCGTLIKGVRSLRLALLPLSRHIKPLANQDVAIQNLDGLVDAVRIALHES